VNQLHQKAHPLRAVFCNLLADFGESEFRMEGHRIRIRRNQVDFAGQDRCGGIRQALDIRIERTTNSSTFVGWGHCDAIDVYEIFVALTEPAVIQALVALTGPQRHKETGNFTIDDRDAEITALLR